MPRARSGRRFPCWSTCSVSRVGDGVRRAIDAVLVMLGMAVVGDLLGADVWAVGIGPSTGLATPFRRGVGDADFPPSEVGEPGGSEPSRRRTLTRLSGALLNVVLVMAQAWRWTMVGPPPSAVSMVASGRGSIRPSEPAPPPPSISPANPVAVVGPARLDPTCGADFNPPVGTRAAPVSVIVSDPASAGPADLPPTLPAEPLDTPASAAPDREITPAAAPAGRVGFSSATSALSA